jgi:hypothetical protein
VDAGLASDLRKARQQMVIGPVRLIVLVFNHPDFHGEIITDWIGFVRTTRSA